MTVFNFGSINIDHVYRVPHLPAAGETLASTGFHSGLGGKGANQSIAIAKAGGKVVHIGAVGPEGRWTVEMLAQAGVDTDHIATLETPTGHAIINVDDAGENAIVLFHGANTALTQEMIDSALTQARAGDWLLLQNETNLAFQAAQAARSRGLKVAYAAAPFVADVARRMLPVVDLLAVNDIEAAQLAEATGSDLQNLPVPEVLITRGAKGATLRTGGGSISVPAFPVHAVDTTGAGDTFTGYFMAAIDAGWTAQDALTQAAAASAIQVTRAGAAQAIPDKAEVMEFMKGIA